MLSALLAALISAGATLTSAVKADNSSAVNAEAATPAITEIDELDLHEQDVTALYPEITDFVTRLYDTCLNRTPDSVGLANWVSRIASGEYTAAYVVKGFFGSSEFKSKKLPDDEFVRTLYRTMLDRDPAQSEVDYWAARRQMGVTDDYMIKGFIGSDEFTNICKQSGVERGNITLTDIRDKNINITGFCARMYTCCLGRSFDVNGLSSWVNKVINQNYTAADVALGFFNSSEFKNKDLSDSDYVTALYKTILNRTPSGSEIEYWAKRRQHGVSCTYILRGFVASQEFKGLCESYGMTQGSIPIPPVMLDVMEYNQHPDYPTGCESAALYMLLKYYNVDVTMEQIVTALPKGPLPYYSGGVRYGANPETEFVGDPRNSYSYGVFNEPLAQTAEQFLSGVTTKTGAALSEVTNLLDQHIPVVVWYSTDPYYGISYNESWYDYQTGALVRWPAGEHAIVVCGHDDSTITYRDPNTGSSRTIARSTFENVYNQLGGRILYYGY